MHDIYTYIWEYVVNPAYEEEFLNAYGPDGRWVEMFREHGGYMRTELARDRENPHRYLTIDYWESREAWERFREVADERFRRLDKECELFTMSEREIGTFAMIQSPRTDG